MCVCVVQVREELLRARQTHRSELDGMRTEVSRLTAELHHRDLAVASMEAERLEQNTAGVKVGRPTTRRGILSNSSCFNCVKKSFDSTADDFPDDSAGEPESQESSTAIRTFIPSGPSRPSFPVFFFFSSWLLSLRPL